MCGRSQVAVVERDRVVVVEMPQKQNRGTFTSVSGNKWVGGWDKGNQHWRWKSQKV